MITSHTQPWLITLEAYCELNRAEQRAAGAQACEATRAAEPPYELRDGLATVRLHGPMFRRLTPRMSAAAAFCGLRLCSMEETGAALLQAAADPAVRTLLLDIDSPGGTVNGTPELAQLVRGIARQKHVYSFTAGQCCSAAYWIASQTDVIYAAPSSAVGSIGVLLPLVDCSALYQSCGLKMEVFAAGKYKTIGLEGTSLTDEQREHLSEQVNKTWADFRHAVTRRRLIAPEDMEGQSFYGTEAREKKLVDACVLSLPALQEKLIRRHAADLSTASL